VDVDGVDGDDELLTIGAFAARARLSAKALRLYDRLGLLAPAHVDAANGYRTPARRSTLQGGGVGHLRQSGPEGLDVRARIALSDNGVVRPTAGRAESNACGGPCKTSSRKGAGKGL